MTYCYSFEHVRFLRTLAKNRGLFAPPSFWKSSVDVLRQCYNGVGPDAWSPRFRTFVTHVLARFEADALIHDFEYTFQPRTYSAFTMANVRFALNSCINAKDDISHTRFAGSILKRFLSQCAAGLLLAALCQLFGWHGYVTNKAKEKNDYLY